VKNRKASHKGTFLRILEAESESILLLALILAAISHK